MHYTSLNKIETICISEVSRFLLAHPNSPLSEYLAIYSFNTGQDYFLVELAMTFDEGE